MPPDHRPSTSKARGVCIYYSTPRGCIHGDRCKFLHGDTENLTPYDKSKTCKFYAAGFCRRGTDCWFLHQDPVAELVDSQVTGALETKSEVDPCSICYEVPTTYGLLAGCGHIFCLQCIRGWRDPHGKPDDMVRSGNTKKCPSCRAPSKFITPSSVFFADGDPQKTLVIEQYKASMARIPCKYFQASNASNRTCPYGRDCFYQHRNEDGSDYVFPHGADYYFKQRRQGSRRFDDYNARLLQSLHVTDDITPASVSAVSQTLRDIYNMDTHEMTEYFSRVISRIETVIADTAISAHEQPEDSSSTAGHSSASDSRSPLPLTRSAMSGAFDLDCDDDIWLDELAYNLASSDDGYDDYETWSDGDHNNIQQVSHPDTSVDDTSNALPLSSPRFRSLNTSTSDSPPGQPRLRVDRVFSELQQGAVIIEDSSDSDNADLRDIDTPDESPSPPFQHSPFLTPAFSDTSRTLNEHHSVHTQDSLINLNTSLPSQPYSPGNSANTRPLASCSPRIGDVIDVDESSAESVYISTDQQLLAAPSIQPVMASNQSANEDEDEAVRHLRPPSGGKGRKSHTSSRAASVDIPELRRHRTEPKFVTNGRGLVVWHVE